MLLRGSHSCFFSFLQTLLAIPLLYVLAVTIISLDNLVIQEQIRVAQIK
jgi:hypothetical protein